MTKIQQQYDDFAKNAGCPPTGPDDTVHVPYILVSSLTQTTLDRTPKIDEAVKSQLGSATWEQIKGCFQSIYHTDPKHVTPLDFLVLDNQSLEDRTVAVMHRKPDKMASEESHPTQPWLDGQEGVTEVWVWNKYRPPYEEAFNVQCGIEGFCGLETAEKYFEDEVEREVATRSWSQA